MKAREFNLKSYRENDDYAREIFKNYITKKGHTIIRDEETYGIDMVTEKDGKKYYFELEVSSLTFNGRDSYPYEKVNFLERKKKYTEEADFFYVIISRTGMALMAESKDIFDGEGQLIKFYSKSRGGIDFYFQLPKDKIKFFKIK